ncbi:MAG: trypsin-like peptidase domain-containing protein [Anaerolineales bacterium]|nr:trypsin-like peptidase domain-containing protein [Anaerolineales bacterium]
MNDFLTLIADFSASEFVKIPMFPHPTQKSIMPVVSVKDDQIKPLGTCFAISNHGLVLTARHVIEDAIEIKARSDGWWVGVIYVSEPMPEDDVPDLLGGIILAKSIHTSDDFDIGLMHLNLPKRSDTGAFLTMPALKLSPAIPRTGDICFTLGYYNSRIESTSDNPYHIAVERTYSASKGAVEEIHFPKRDSVSLKFPCFRTSLRHERGMSGAPVLSKDGGVIGVVCSAIEGEDIYYVSLIGPALFLQIDAINAEGNADKVFLYDFITGGAVGVDETINQLSIHRQGNSLEISFGIPPILNSKLDS